MTLVLIEILLNYLFDAESRPGPIFLSVPGVLCSKLGKYVLPKGDVHAPPERGPNPSPPS